MYNGAIRKTMITMGIDPYKHLPLTGTAPVTVVHEHIPVQAWVAPKGYQHSNTAHRLVARCLICGNVYSLGRIVQHNKVHK